MGNAHGFVWVFPSPSGPWYIVKGALGGLLLLGVPGLILDQLVAQPGIGFAELCLWVVAFRYLPTSIAHLARLAKMSRTQAARVCNNLVALGWMVLKGSARRLRPVPLIPHACQKEMASILQEEYEMAPNRGEFLMKRHLDLLIHSDDYVDNARPRFLKNPMTTHPLEYDRYYRQKIAFEFNGTQHHEVTPAYPSDKALQRTQTRDTLKRGLSDTAGVRLIVITPDDLDARILLGLIPPDLPRNPIDAHGPYYTALAEMSAVYRARAAQAANP